MPELALDQLIRHFRLLVRRWVGDEVISAQSREITYLVVVPSISERYMCGDRKSSGNIFAMC